MFWTPNPNSNEKYICVSKEIGFKFDKIKRYFFCYLLIWLLNLDTLHNTLKIVWMQMIGHLLLFGYKYQWKTRGDINLQITPTSKKKFLIFSLIFVHDLGKWKNLSGIWTLCFLKTNSIFLCFVNEHYSLLRVFRTKKKNNQQTMTEEQDTNKVPTWRISID